MTNNPIDISGSVSGGNVNIGGSQHFHGDVHIHAPNPNASAIRAETTGSILISYSRRDREAVKKLYAGLTALGFNLWRDLHDIEGGEPFWEAIKQAIDACESVVLCLSPEALKSAFVQKEWHYARQQGKRVIPVVVDAVDFATVPRWMTRIDWKDFREGQPERDTVWASFIRTLNTPYHGRKVPFMAAPLPHYFVQRPDEFEPLVAALVDGNGAVAITAAVKGAGGFGKTTLAQALCHENRIRGAFDDGILWVTLGENPTEADLLRKALDLIYELTGVRPAVESKEAVKAELQKAIGDRHILLVLDDLWRKHDADLFLTDCPNNALLITTRLDAQLPEQTRFKQHVDAMRLEQAVQLLTWGITEDTTPHQIALQALAERLGEWAVLLRLVNATLRKRINQGESLRAALGYADKALTRKGLVAFDSRNEGQRTEAVSATLRASLELLDEVRKGQFARLAIFPEDTDIPFATLEKLWGLDDFDTEEAVAALNDAGLLQNVTLEERTLRLHDVIRRYLIDEHRTDLIAWQANFVDAVGDLYSLANEYEWRAIAYHLIEARKRDKLQNLLTKTDDWIKAKLEIFGTYESILTDIELCLSSYSQNTPDEIIATAGLWAVHHVIHELISSYEISRLIAMVLIDKYIENNGKRTREALGVARLKSEPKDQFDYLFTIWEALNFDKDYYDELKQIIRQIDDAELRKQKLTQLENAIQKSTGQPPYVQRLMFSDDTDKAYHQQKIEPIPIKDCAERWYWNNEDFLPNLITLIVEISSERFDPEIYEFEEQYLQEILENEGLYVILTMIENQHISEAIYLIENNEELSDFLNVPDEPFEIAGLLAKQGCQESIKVYEIAEKYIDNHAIRGVSHYDIAILLANLNEFDLALRVLYFYPQLDLFGTHERILGFIEMKKADQTLTAETFMDKLDLGLWYPTHKIPQAMALSQKGIFTSSEGAFNNMGLQRNTEVYLSNVMSWYEGLEAIEQGLTVKILREIIRIMAWNNQSWLWIQEILETASVDNDS